MDEMKLIPGFRFHPTDVELVQYFLKRKVLGKKFPCNVIAEIDIYKYPPWDLPAHSLLKNGDLEWFFFCGRGKKYASGARMNRTTAGGFWKTTGKDRPIVHKKHLVGMIKTLVFHVGKAPKGVRTDWVMHEFRLEDKDLSDKGIPQDSYVICKVFQKDGPGPRNGAQYGKPFNEEDWDDDEEIDIGSGHVDVSVSAPIQPTTGHSSLVNDMHPASVECFGSTSVSCLSGSIPSCSTNPPASSDQVEDDILEMLDSFKEDNTMAVDEDNIIEKVDSPARAINAGGLPCFDPNGIFGDLEDLNNLSVLGEDGHGYPNGKYTPNGMLSTGDDLWMSDPDFMELNDLDVPLFWENQKDK